MAEPNAAGERSTMAAAVEPAPDFTFNFGSDGAEPSGSGAEISDSSGTGANAVAELMPSLGKIAMQTFMESHSGSEAVRDVSSNGGSIALVLDSSIMTLSGGSVSVGDPLRVHWELSSQFDLFVSRIDGDKIMRYPADKVVLVRLEQSRDDAKSMDVKRLPIHRSSPSIFLYDASVDYSSGRCVVQKLAPLQHPMATDPVPIEPGLVPFISPFSARFFREKIFNQKAFVLHTWGAKQRTKMIREEMCDFDVPKLLQSASKIVVWMKDLRGKMQYLEAGPDVAASCFSAGHSLYFNPPVEQQRRWISEICSDLGMDFGICMDSSGFGGDLEVFAVRGKHKTPWHYDAQHNFTIQLTGCKNWTVAPPDAKDPMINLHPSSGNFATLERNRIINASYSSVGEDMEGASGEKEAERGIERFSLRPGSVAYVPAGWWHKVETAPSNPSDVSLSINFSVDGGRWCDLILSRLTPALWAADARWRQRVMQPLGCPGTPLSGFRDVVSELLTSLKTVVGKLESDQIIPKGLLLADRPPGNRFKIPPSSGSQGGEEHLYDAALERAVPMEYGNVVTLRGVSVEDLVVVWNPCMSIAKVQSQREETDTKTVTKTITYKVSAGHGTANLMGDYKVTLEIGLADQSAFDDLCKERNAGVCGENRPGKTTKMRKIVDIFRLNEKNLQTFRTAIGVLLHIGLFSLRRKDGNHRPPKRARTGGVAGGEHVAVEFVNPTVGSSSSGPRQQQAMRASAPSTDSVGSRKRLQRT